MIPPGQPFSPSNPSFRCGSPLLNSAFRVAIGDLVGNIQPFQDGLLDAPRPCILAGLEYDTPWTRDTAINVWNGAGLIFPEVARNTLLSVLTRDSINNSRKIVGHTPQFSENGKQDLTQPTDGPVHIGGQYWDAIIWTTGAWAYYLYTGDREFLALALEATRNSLECMEQAEFNPQTGLFRGPACYGDGVAAYPDIYAQTGGASCILDWPKWNPEQVSHPGFGLPMQALSTNCLVAHAYRLAGAMAHELSQPADPDWAKKASALRAAINAQFWDPGRSAYRYLVDPFGGCDHQEGLGNCFAILLDIAGPEQASAVIENQVITPNGIPCVWPAFERYRKDPLAFGRHSGTIWPHIQGFWAEAAARAGAMEKFHFELFKLAGLSVRDGMFAEIYHPLTGEVYGGLQEGAAGWNWHSCRRQTWSATGFLRMILMGLAGMKFSPEGIHFHPLMPGEVSPLHLSGLLYHGQPLTIHITGQGNRVTRFTRNGRNEQPAAFLSAGEKGPQDIELTVE